MSGGIESMHEDERIETPCRGCGKPRSLKGLYMFYEAAREVTDPAEKAQRALELCHQLIIELSNHVYCLHGKDASS